MAAGNEKKINKRRVVASLLGLPVYFGLFMFLPAGDWTWPKGWLFIGVFVGVLAVVTPYLWRVNPEVVVARTGVHEGTKRWDKILLGFFFTAVYAIAPVAALDDGRFHWLPVPWWVCGIGYLAFLVGMAIVTWAEAVNKFFEVTVRIQAERGQKVIEAGPYAVVRHPGYVGGILFSLGIALCLGSLWALIPAGLASCLLILRTKWEDEVLQAELAGYNEYAEQVRYKLIPGLW
ncbi:MAG TPA: isoprenylcysteine carboxylmethyltransferase family protein [Pirellulales bacterium]|nr:isoprenylcysteine carboxylmethyltransferase family protein [Pirellulales bacterium]